MRSGPVPRRCMVRLMSEQQAVTPDGPRTESAPARQGPGAQGRCPPNACLVAIVLIGISYATMIQSFSWNQTSHYDLIRSLNDDGTTIDAYQANTGDKVIYKGHYYSARAPVWRCSRCPSTTR